MFETIDVTKFEEWFEEWYKNAKQFKMSNKDIARAAFLSGWNSKEQESRSENARLEQLWKRDSEHLLEVGAENKRLREALKSISLNGGVNANIARAALKQ